MIQTPTDPSAAADTPLVTRWIWAVAAWVLVIFFSSTSLASQWAEGTFHMVSKQPSTGLFHLLVDKGFHVSLFCLLAILLWLSLPPAPHKQLVILCCGAVVGSCSEFLQRFFPDRDPAIRDVFINIGGTVCGVLLCQAALGWKSRRRARTLDPASV